MNAPTRNDGGRPSLGLIAVLTSILLLFAAACGKKEKAPPSPDVVATYEDGEITVERLREYLEKRTRGLMVWAGDSLVPFNVLNPLDLETCRTAVREIVLDDLVRRLITERQLDNRANIRHALQHLEEEVTLQELHNEIHEKDRIPVDEVEIQSYYDANRARFRDRSLSEVRDEIKNNLAAQREDEFFSDYISELRDSATITKYYDILRIPEPTEEELRQAYQENRESYLQPERWVIDQIEVAAAATNPERDAQRAWAKLGSGNSFEEVAEEFAVDRSVTSFEHVLGMRGEAFDQAVTSLSPGEYSRPIKEDGKWYVIRLKQAIPASYLPFEAVRGLIRRILMEEREGRLYEEKKNQTLFLLHGRRFTLGDFYQEFQELPPAEQEQYWSYADRTKLVDLMVDRLVLLEDSYDRMLNASKKEEIEHVREDVLMQALHNEEVDQKLELTDEELKSYYEENKDEFKTPPKVKISLILVRGGAEEEEDKEAKKKIDEAYKKLKPGLFKKAMPFEDVARLFSEDTRTAPEGGAIDYWIQEGANLRDELLNHALHEKFMNLEEGEITEPFAFGRNYIIVRVREKMEPQQQSFEEVKDHLRVHLEALKHEELTAKMYTDMLENANLVIYDQVLDKMVGEQEEVVDE